MEFEPIAAIATQQRAHMPREFDLIGLGNSLVDILLELTDDGVRAARLREGDDAAVEPRRAKDAARWRFGDHEPRLVSGGSVANSVIACSQLGGTGAFIGCVGDDRYGLHYTEEFAELGIDFANPPLVGETTGTCVSIITPDAERTMRTCLAVSSHLAARHVPADKIAAAEWLFVEGYVFANPQHRPARDPRSHHGRAKAAGTKVALTCSDAFVPQVFGDVFRRSARAKRSALLQRDRGDGGRRRQRRAEEAFGKLKGMVPAGRDRRPQRGVRALPRVGVPRPGVPVRAGGPDRRRRHVRRGVPLRHHARRARGEGRPRRELPGDEGHHADRRPAAPRA